MSFCFALELFASRVAGQGPLPAEAVCRRLFAILHVNYSLSRGTSFRITQMTSLKRGFLNLHWQQLLPPWEHSFSYGATWAQWAGVGDVQHVGRQAKTGVSADAAPVGPTPAPLSLMTNLPSTGLHTGCPHQGNHVPGHRSGHWYVQTVLAALLCGLLSFTP